MSGEQMFHQGIDPFVLAPRQLAIFIELEVLRSTNLSRLSERGLGLLENSIQRLALNFCAHGAELYKDAQASQWYGSTMRACPSVASLLFLWTFS
jgi:hypothetical protein